MEEKWQNELKSVKYNYHFINKCKINGEKIAILKKQVFKWYKNGLNKWCDNC